MIRQVSRFVQQCPVCGRPVPIGSEHEGRTVLLAEYRDEVFARVATDLAQAGLRVVRAASAQEAAGPHACHRPVLAIVNRDLPESSGWLLASKLRVADPAVRVWVYQPTRSAADVTMARFLGVDELVDYGGDVLRLSDAILDCLAGRAAPRSRSHWHQIVTGVDAASPVPHATTPS